MDAYAVIETGGKQYRVQAGDTLDIGRVDGEAGAKLTIEPVLAASDGTTLKVGKPAIEGASVLAEVVEQHRGKKVVAFKKKRRKGYHKKIGHRQELTRIRISEIQAG